MVQENALCNLGRGDRQLTFRAVCLELETVRFPIQVPLTAKRIPQRPCRIAVVVGGCVLCALCVVLFRYTRRGDCDVVVQQSRGLEKWRLHAILYELIFHKSLYMLLELARAYSSSSMSTLLVVPSTLLRCRNQRCPLKNVGGSVLRREGEVRQ